MYPELQLTVDGIANSGKTISTERAERLGAIAAWIKVQRAKGNTAHLAFICTHNSRRSQFAQVWAKVAAHRTGLKDIHTSSAGTEGTAVASPVIDALRAQGFRVDGAGDLDIHGNAVRTQYLVNYDDEEPPVLLFSKSISDRDDTAVDFAAVMVCSDADENCPFVPGAVMRFSLPYEDPKESDGTADEARTYQERSLDIAREMNHLMDLVIG